MDGGDRSSSAERLRLRWRGRHALERRRPRQGSWLQGHGLRQALLAVVMPLATVSCAARQGPEASCSRQSGQSVILHIDRPDASFFARDVCVAVTEERWRRRDAQASIIRMRDYVGGSMNDWSFRREWDLDGDGVYDCREDECSRKSERLGQNRRTACVSRLVAGTWKAEPETVVECVNAAELEAL